VLKDLFIGHSSPRTYKNRPMTRPRFILLTVLLLTAGALNAGERDHELARQALERGQVLALRTVLDKIEREYPGQVLKVEFEREDGRFVYEIRLLQNDGRMAKLTVDAADGRVIEIKRRD
jgi:uncharacterized membrane protein YkoI